MTESNESNKTSNVFVMTRPKEGESLMVIQTKAQADKMKDIEEMFQSCFTNYIINLNQDLSSEEHHDLLSIAIPSVAYHFYLNDAENANKYLQDVLDPENKEKKELRKVLEEQHDEVSQLSLVIYDKLISLIIESEERGFNEAIVDHHDFFSDFKMIFDSLPTSICEAIVKTALILEKARVKPIKKTNIKE